MYRQGDILLIPVTPASGPVTTKSDPTKGPRIVLAHGAATGHEHVVQTEDGSLSALVGTEDNLLSLPTDALLVHDEHATIALPAGEYFVRRQREYSPEAVRRVED